MSKPVSLQRTFQRGMRRDNARDQMPQGSSWNLIDYLPGLQGRLRKRGGWQYHSNDIAAVKATASYVIGGIYAPFTAAAKNVCIDEDGELYTVAANGTVTDVGAAGTVSQNPFFHRNKVIIPAASGAAAPKYYDGTVLGNLAGSPPSGIYGCVYKDYSVLARDATTTTRLWFSDPGTPTSWDTVNSYWDTSFPVTGLAALRNAILVWSDGHTERLRGSVPPPGSDFILDPLFEVGCTDARSVALYGDNAVFANPSGIWMTDGASAVDLTQEGGMTTYWQETVLSGYDSASWTITGGIYRNYYVCAVMNGSTFQDALLIDIGRRPVTIVRLGNFKARAFWRAVAGAEELYMGLRSAARVGKVSPVFMPQAAYKNDGDGTAVAPVWETPFYGDPAGLKDIGHIFLRADIRDAAADNPTLTVSYVTSPEATAYTALSPAMSETTAIGRVKLAVNKTNVQGVAFKVAQTNASSDTRGYDIDAEIRLKEASGV